MKKMLITSGGWLALKLIKYFYRRYDITVLIRDEERKTKISQMFPLVKFIFADLQFSITAENDFDIVIHCAAMKNIETEFLNKDIVYRCNVIGTKNLLEWCKLRNQYVKIIHISTDKIVFPKSYYGYTKLKAEMLCRDYRNQGMNISVVRFGNIWASSGSILQILIKRKIWNIRKYEISHPDSERYFLRWQEAAALIEKSITSDGKLLIGEYKSARIVDIYKALFGDVELKVVGLRPGEKIKEDLGVEQGEKKYYTINEMQTLFKEIMQEELGGMLS